MQWSVFYYFNAYAYFITLVVCLILDQEFAKAPIILGITFRIGAICV